MAINKWLGEDQEIRDFVKSINNNVILANNCVENLYEEITRPFRKQCLDELNKFINGSDKLIRTKFTLGEIVERLRMAYMKIKFRGSNHAEALGITLTNVANQNVSCGECSVCLDHMDIREMHLTPCQHCFHAKCIQQVFKENRKCPICQSEFNEVYRIVLFKNDA